VAEYFALIKNKNILITGTSGGIGNYLAKNFLKNGNKVWGCSRKKNNIKHKNFFHKRFDLSDPKKLIYWTNRISKNKNFKIDILINNAAVYEKNLSFFHSKKNITDSYKINCISPIILTNIISKMMLKNKKGLIIFISSVAAILDEPGTSLYASSKAALESYARIIREEISKFNVKVSIIRIQYIKTSLSKTVNKIKLSALRKKFISNKIGSKEKIYSEINKLYFKKKAPLLISDKLK